MIVLIVHIIWSISYGQYRMAKKAYKSVPVILFLLRVKLVHIFWLLSWEIHWVGCNLFVFLAIRLNNIKLIFDGPLISSCLRPEHLTYQTVLQYRDRHHQISPSCRPLSLAKCWFRLLWLVGSGPIWLTTIYGRFDQPWPDLSASHSMTRFLFTSSRKSFLLFASR